MNLLPQIFKVLLKIYRESIKKQERPLKTKLKADLPDVTTSNKIHKKQSTKSNEQRDTVNVFFCSFASNVSLERRRRRGTPDLNPTKKQLLSHFHLLYLY